MPLPTTTASRCSFCHGGPCPFEAPAPLLCGEGGNAPHDVPASMVVEYRVDLSGARDFDHGDVEARLLYSCSHPACLTSAEQHAHDAGALIDTRPLTVADYEDATGYLAVSA